jgi:hypothetical protein
MRLSETDIRTLLLLLLFFLFPFIQCTFQEYVPPIKSNQQRKYFVDDWPENLVNLWPSLKESTPDMKVTSHLNYGTGSLLNESIGMFDSFQFGESPLPTSFNSMPLRPLQTLSSFTIVVR